MNKKEIRFAKGRIQTNDTVVLFQVIHPNKETWCCNKFQVDLVLKDGTIIEKYEIEGWPISHCDETRDFSVIERCIERNDIVRFENINPVFESLSAFDAPFDIPLRFEIDRIENKKAFGTLTWNEKGLSSPAVSGPYGKGELPEGFYHVNRDQLVDTIKDGFCDKNNKCWFQKIEPQFSTNPPRTGLGIHPDGNVPGTEGCIGILDEDTKEWFEAFKSIEMGGITYLEVKKV